MLELATALLLCFAQQQAKFLAAHAVHFYNGQYDAYGAEIQAGSDDDYKTFPPEPFVVAE